MPSSEAQCAVERFLATVGDRAPSRLTLQRSLSEAWFSNTLAWLLDSKGSHHLGVAFAEAFMAKIAERRSAGLNGQAYERRDTFLKRGKGGRGVGASGFTFANASVLREFHLARSVQRDGRGGRYCDLVLLDLDSADSFFLTIENKLFMRASAPQLRAYQDAVDEKYDRAKVREFVLLTLRMTDPLAEDEDGAVSRTWVHLSWTQDIRALLDALVPASVPARSALASLRRLLAWLDWATDPAGLPDDARTAFRDDVVQAAAACLLDELNRLHADGAGEWTLKSRVGRRATLRHSSHRSTVLRVSLLPGLSVSVQGRAGSGRGTFDKIIVPFGAPPTQVLNLLDVAARDVYRKHFSDPSRFRGTARRRSVTRGAAATRHDPLFRFVHRHDQALKVVLYRACAVSAP